MTQKNNRQKIIYACLVLLIVSVSVMIAVASGAAKRSKPSATSNDTSLNGIFTSKPDESSTKSEEGPDESNPSDNASENAVTTEATLADVTEIHFITPVAGTLLNECSLKIPVYSLTMNDYRTHMGVDIAAEPATPVASAADGVISAIYADPMMGMTVKIEHTEGVYTVYQNLSEELPEGVVVGKPVTAGEIIGAIGESALIECEEVSHLHFELYVNDEVADPCGYIELKKTSDSFED